MQVRHHDGGIGQHGIQERLGEVSRFHGTDAEALETRHLSDGVEEVGEMMPMGIFLLSPQRRFMAVCADKNSREDDFPVPELDEPAGLGDGIGDSF